MQLELFAAGRPGFDSESRSLRRTCLAHGAWVDHSPGWVGGHAVLFDELERGLAWRRETMKMYDKIVDVPRLLAQVPQVGLVAVLQAALSARYGERFVVTTAALYRDGRDSVAFHGDTGPSIAFALGRGDLVVMGGTAQRTWRHGIPKVASASPRIALMFRPAWGKSYV